ncbi:MAG: hypothetical protein ABSB49_17575 [Polyangia bacterium]|jgi:hypothetical protein
MDHHGLIRARACLFAAGILLVGCENKNTIARPSGTGAGTVLTWTSGTTPVSQTTGVAIELNNVAFGGNGSDGGDSGLFVAVGEAGTILTSPDGVTWTSQNSNTPLNLYGVTFASNQFIAVGGNSLAGAGVILSGSPDGTSWTVEDASSALATNLTGVTYANGQLVAVGNNLIVVSTDGSNWSSLPPAPSGITGPTVALYNVTYGNNLFVTVGAYNQSTPSQEIVYDGLIATSSDATSWSILPYTSNYLSGVTYGAGQFVAVGREGSILTSSDGTTWTPQSAPGLNISRTPYLISVLYAERQFVATGNYVGINPSTGFLVTSPDGVTWTVLPTTGANLYGIAYGLVAGVGTYVAVGGQ